MSFLKKLFGTDPLEKLRNELPDFNFPNTAFNVYEILKKYEKNDIDTVINEMIKQGIWEDNFIGNQGWYLKNLDEKLDELHVLLKKGPLDLEKWSKSFGLNQKRLFLALEHHIDKKSQSDLFTRSESTLFLNSFLYQKWLDTLATSDFEEEESFDILFDRVRIEKEYKELLKKLIIKRLREGGADIALGLGDIIRRKSIIKELMPEYIETNWEEGTDQLLFSTIGEHFGLTVDEVSKFITELMGESQLDSSTVYPVDELIKPKSM